MNTLIDKILGDCVNKAYEMMDSKSFGDPYKSAKSELLKAILEVVGGCEIDIEATESHIRKATIGKSEDEIAERLLEVNIEADDRKDTLDDVRKVIKALFGEDKEG